MKHQLLRLALTVPLILLGAWPRISIAQAAIPYAVVAWGNNEYGQTTVPVAAQSGVKAIAAGYFHTVALKSDGSVMAWGLNNFLQSTVPVAAQSGVTAIAAGPYHTVALKQDGTVVAWGYNGNGEVTGTPTTDAAYSTNASPVTLGGQVLSGVTAIAAGGGYTVALKNDGSVAAWGYNGFGQTTVPVTAQSGVTAIAAGAGHAVALKNDGSVLAWGLNDGGQTTVPLAAQSGVVAIAAGNGHTAALKNDGSVVAWGWNAYGQTTVPGAARSGVAAIAAGERHTVALKNDGSVMAWGDNSFDQVAVPVAAQNGVAAIAAGYAQTFALVIPTVPNITTQPVGQAVNVWQRAGFTVTATGYPLNYQWRKDGVDLAGATSATYLLPFAQTTQAGSYTVVVSNSAGSVTSAPPAVLTVNPAAAGAVVAWGRSLFEQPTVPVGAQSGVTAISIAGSVGRNGDANTVALKEDGSVVAWGGNCCGLADVPIAARSGVTAIAAGTWHTVALKNDGSVVSWGTLDQTTVPVAAQSGVTAIAAGHGHTIALKNDGSVVSWDSLDQTTVPIAAQSGVTAIAAGYAHSVALKNDGSVVVWGWNHEGQTDVPVAAQSGVAAIAAGFGHTVALKNDGTVVAWGRNGEGQVTGTPTLGDPPPTIASPVTLEGQVLSGVTAIAASAMHLAPLGDPGSHTVALKNDGTVVAWGYNRFGQVTATTTSDDPYSAIASPVTPGGQILSGVTAIAAGHFQTVALIGGVPLLPALKVRPNGNELILSWPTNAPGFTLQSTLDLTTPETWLDSTNAPAVIGTHFTLTNTPSGGARFYRLRKMQPLGVQPREPGL